MTLQRFLPVKSTRYVQLRQTSRRRHQKLTVWCSLSVFRQLSQADMRTLIMSSQTKSHAQHSLNIFVVLACSRTAGICDIHSELVVESRLSARLTEACNHHAISKEARITGRCHDVYVEDSWACIAKQLHQYLTDNELLPCYQSAYRRHHLTETVVVRFLSNVVTAADVQVTLLGLLVLDLSVMFNCTNNQLLLHQLRWDFGLVSAVLGWITSFVTYRTETDDFAIARPLVNTAPR